MLSSASLLALKAFQTLSKSSRVKLLFRFETGSVGVSPAVGSSFLLSWFFKSEREGILIVFEGALFGAGATEGCSEFVWAAGVSARTSFLIGSACGVLTTGVDTLSTCFGVDSPFLSATSSVRIFFLKRLLE
ncbi:hypothetical protein OB69_05785 [Roseivirga seohaensis subsp. aquiponti]|uniref:Uncharacterized protein n=1 Tax=Roseivirga seohaensis subsp. aquiponti TaxID=1566026 RepID=A0A0L8AM36_9BACT|nr:hypothetical protein OB69_05785 [Roseivirga seohaensis subsp. aquiponti]